MRQPRILMCPPDFYGIEYEINPWMSRSRGSSPERARGQWQRLHDTLAGLGATVELMTPQPGLPDLVFTANAGLVFGNRFFSSRFRHEVRAASRRTSTPGSPTHGFTVEHLPAGMFFEGAGDALFCGTSLFAGYRIRSDVQGCQHLAGLLRRQVLPLELVNPYFLPSRYMLLPAGARRGDLLPGGVRRVRPQGAGDAHPAADRGRGGRGQALRLQRGGGGQDGGGERRLRPTGGGPAVGGLYAGRGGAGRVFEVRRQRQVFDAAAGRRRGGGMGVKGERHTNPKRKRGIRFKSSLALGLVQLIAMVAL